eukprot:326849-Amphidinium_carterae.1
MGGKYGVCGSVFGSFEPLGTLVVLQLSSCVLTACYVRISPPTGHQKSSQNLLTILLWFVAALCRQVVLSRGSEGTVGSGASGRPHAAADLHIRCRNSPTKTSAQKFSTWNAQTEAN